KQKSLTVAAMKNGTSLYLDIVRFSAAALVFLEHIREHTRASLRAFWTAHPFVYSHIYSYSQMAVIVFFVLSGYVIAHVLATRERTPLEYAASRFGRLYSVVVPALILTAVANFAMELRHPGAFASYGDSSYMVLRYLGTALFVNRFWMFPNLEP